MAVVDRHGPHLDAMLARIADDLRGRVEAHRLRVEQRGAKDVRMMMLHPAGRIGDLRKTRGVALGKAVTAEALDLLERTLGELFRIAALDHPPDKFVIEVRHRSEEHTSELQSLMRTSYAVFCLKKK